MIVQNTGIGRYVRTGTGLLTFTEIDSADEAINHVGTLRGMPLPPPLSHASFLIQTSCCVGF